MGLRKKGFMIVRAVLAVFIGIGLLVCLVVLHPLVVAMVNNFLAGSSDPVQNFGVRMIPVFYVFVVFVSMVITLVIGE